MWRLCIASYFAFFLLVSQSFGDIIITLNFTGGLSASQQIVFAGAKEFWETALTGYQPGIVIAGPTINASGVAIDGVGGTLGSAGPSTTTTQGGFVLTTTGQMEFDIADLSNLEANGSLQNVIRHEIAHVLGLGTLWTGNNVYRVDTGQFTGSAALNQYKTEFNQLSATFVPVELGGGIGTANGHWDEVDFGGGLTGIRDSLNRDMRDELMTGWLNPNSFVSNMTIASFSDIGFTTAVPEPGSLAFVGFSIVAILFLKRHKRIRP